MAGPSNNITSHQTRDMLARFRRKFVLMTMVFASAVMVIVFLVVSSLTFVQERDDVYNALGQRIEMAKNRSRMDQPGEFGMGFAPERMLTSGIEHTDTTTVRQREPHSDGPDGHSRESSDDQFVATSLYLLDNEGALVASFDEAFPIEETVLEDVFDNVMDHVGDTKLGVERSFLRGNIASKNLYYQIESYDNGYMVALASGRYIESNIYNIVGPLLVSELVALLAFLGLSLLLARWVVGPFEQAWDQQQQFIADASHELKTPLTVIRANNSILLSQPESTVEEQSQWIENSETEAKLMQELVDDMLYLAKADNAKVPEEKGTVSLSDIVGMQILQFESVAFEKNIQIDSNIDEGVTLEGDNSRLSRMVGTLLDNACKYANEGSKIDVNMAKHGSMCRLTVHNTGSVIDPEDLPHVFDRFYRGDKARTRTQGGYGLGLAIARSIVEEHGGEIGATSSEEAGTTFTVDLPVDK